MFSDWNFKKKNYNCLLDVNFSSPVDMGWIHVQVLSFFFYNILNTFLDVYFMD